MSEIVIKEFSKLAEHPGAAQAAARASAELMRRFDLHFGVDHWDRPALVALDGDHVVGFFQFSIDDNLPVAHVDLAWCDPGRPDVLTTLGLKLRKILRREKARLLKFTHHHGNDQMARLASILGCSPHTITYQMVLASTPETEQ